MTQDKRPNRHQPAAKPPRHRPGASSPPLGSARVELLPKAATKVAADPHQDRGARSSAPDRKTPMGRSPLKSNQIATKSGETKGSGSGGVRIQKVLADAGLGSRREIEGWIKTGRIAVNGRIAQLGDRLNPGDRVFLDGQELRLVPAASAEPIRVIAYHKPEGEIVSRHDPEGRPSVFHHLPPLEQGRWIAIGRLDINTSGLLLLTNNGDLANRLMHPSQEIEREYAVRILGEAPRALLQRLVHGVELDDGPARFEEIVESDNSPGANRWYHVLLREGRNREVRRLWEAVGLRVSRLMRVRFGNVILEPRLFSRQWRELTEEELNGLLELAGMKRPAPARSGSRPLHPWGASRSRSAKARRQGF